MGSGTGSAACESENELLPSPSPAKRQEDSTSGESDSSSGETKDEGWIIHEYQYGSDEEEYEEYDDGTHEMTDKEFRDYHRQVVESEGFDVESFPRSFACCMVIPLSPHHEFADRVKPFSELALQEYNKRKNTNLKVVKVVKANMEVAGALVFYITFDARDVHGDVITFQAEVTEGIVKINGIAKIEVGLCRPKARPEDLICEGGTVSGNL